jgi:hypothetical protein
MHPLDSFDDGCGQQRNLRNVHTTDHSIALDLRRSLSEAVRYCNRAACGLDAAALSLGNRFTWKQGTSRMTFFHWRMKHRQISRAPMAERRVGNTEMDTGADV